MKCSNTANLTRPLVLKIHHTSVTARTAIVGPNSIGPVPFFAREGKPFADFLGANRVHPDWRITSDGKTAYLQLLDDLRMFRVDLTGADGQPVNTTNLGDRIKGEHPDSRGSISIGPDGRVYSAVRIDNNTGFGAGYLHHLVRHDPATGAMEDLGVFAIKNPDFFNFAAGRIKNPDGTERPIHGYHTLPDGTLTPLHVIMALFVAHDGTIYATTIYPFTLMKIETIKAGTHPRNNPKTS